MKTNRFIYLFLIILVGLSACDSEDKTARIQVWLTDSPGDYQEVNIDIQEVNVHADEGGWISLTMINKGVYNILDLTNGLDTLLAEATLPAGKISQIRLVLGNNNSVKIGDEIKSLQTPSAQQSGLKLQVHQTLEEGILYKILLDFDAARSIVHTGNQQHILKPVIRTITEAQSGAIKGIVEPADSSPAIFAIQGMDTLGAAYSDSIGRFLIRGLSAGTFRVSFEPNENYTPYSLDNVEVKIGEATDLQTIVITP